MDGELESEQATLLGDHFDQCESCISFLNSSAIVDETLAEDRKEWSVPTPRVADIARAPWHRRLLIRITAAAAVLLAAIFIVPDLLQEQSKPTPIATHASAAATPLLTPGVTLHFGTKGSADENDRARRGHPILPWLLQHSDFVVHGRVGTVTPESVEFESFELLKGTRKMFDEALTILQGSEDECVAHVSWEAGEECILFLLRQRSSGLLEVRAGRHGKHTLPMSSLYDVKDLRHLCLGRPLSADRINNMLKTHGVAAFDELAGATTLDGLPDQGLLAAAIRQSAESPQESGALRHGLAVALRSLTLSGARQVGEEMLKALDLALRTNAPARDDHTLAATRALLLLNPTHGRDAALSHLESAEPAHHAARASRLPGDLREAYEILMTVDKQAGLSRAWQSYGKGGTLAARTSFLEFLLSVDPGRTAREILRASSVETGGSAEINALNWLAPLLAQLPSDTQAVASLEQALTNKKTAYVTGHKIWCDRLIKSFRTPPGRKSVAHQLHTIDRQITARYRSEDLHRLAFWVEARLIHGPLPRPQARAVAAHLRAMPQQPRWVREGLVRALDLEQACPPALGELSAP